MTKISQIYSKLAALRGQKGFTMIELLIVIAILGILAVAVLSAINPLEQINRGRDTGTQSDAEQLLNAIERFNAFQGHFPWDTGPTVTATAVPWTLATSHTTGTDYDITGGAWAVDPVIAADADCTVLDRLGAGTGDATVTDPTCTVGANELKDSFISRVDDAGESRGLYVYKADNTQSTELYICFSPQSSAFEQTASSRCAESAASLPDPACNTTNPLNPEGKEMVCLP